MKDLEFELMKIEADIALLESQHKMRTYMIKYRGRLESKFEREEREYFEQADLDYDSSREN